MLKMFADKFFRQALAQSDTCPIEPPRGQTFERVDRVVDSTGTGGYTQFQRFTSEETNITISEEHSRSGPDRGGFDHHELKVTVETSDLRATRFRQVDRDLIGWYPNADVLTVETKTDHFVHELSSHDEGTARCKEILTFFNTHASIAGAPSSHFTARVLCNDQYSIPVVLNSEGHTAPRYAKYNK